MLEGWMLFVTLFNNYFTQDHTVQKYRHKYLSKNKATIYTYNDVTVHWVKCQ